MGMYLQELDRSKISTITATGPDAGTLLMLMKGELKNYGYECTEPRQEYEPTWGGTQVVMEVTTNNS